MGCSGPTERWWRWVKATWPHLSPLFFQPLSSDVNHETGCSKTTQTRRERESLLQFSFSHITFLDRPPCLTWKYMLRDPSPKGKSGVTAWADTPQWQQEPEAIWGGKQGDICLSLRGSRRRQWHPTLAWKIPWTEEPGRLQAMVSLRVGHDWATSLSLFTSMHWKRKWQPTPVFLPGESQGREVW